MIHILQSCFTRTNKQGLAMDKGNHHRNLQSLGSGLVTAKTRPHSLDMASREEGDKGFEMVRGDL
jgi:hypothetical protein